MKKEIKELMALATSLGWVYVRMTSDGHYLMEHTVTKSRTTVPATPNGGKRGIKNCRGDLYRWAESTRPRR